MLNLLSAQLLTPKVLPSLGAITALGLPLAAQLPVSAATLIPVNVELSLLVDVSPSVSNFEYALQTGGYRDAFINLAGEFGSGQFGSVAVNFIEWAGPNQQQESIPWTLLDSPASALAFADTIEALVRPVGSSGTAPGSAIAFATPLFSSNQYEGQNWVIDVSGDGVQTFGFPTSLARDNALAAGVTTINGLPIIATPGLSFIKTWYENNVQGGSGSFVIAANGFDDVGRAVEQKLLRELTLPPTDTPPAAIPEPVTILGIALVGGGLASLKRHRSA
ncbi:DUF1194 domain-containing protein [Almyronema epifaneia]|uniref:DUF1194 domain-containing protein n=1 Tax=Almyronema epifaneia S1 TaxID=2991925 RepID=A0ABW6IFW4_9CYAN